MGDIFFMNHHRDSRKVRLVIDRNDNQIYDRTVHVPGGDRFMKTISARWSSEPAEFKLTYVGLSEEVESEIHERTLTAEDAVDGECTIPVIELKAPGSQRQGRIAFGLMKPSEFRDRVGVNCPDR